MQNTSESLALAYSSRNIYIAIAALVDIKFGWERALAEAQRLVVIGAGATAPADSIGDKLFA